MSSLWAFELESKIFSIIKYKGESLLKDDYPTIFFTTSNRNADTPVFPTVYIHELAGVESGKDLTGDEVNAVLETIQIEVYSNDSQDVAKSIMATICEIMKGMAFNITAMPEFNNETTTYRTVARFRRMIGSGDIL